MTDDVAEWRTAAYGFARERDEARETNRRLNLRCQDAESKLATFERAVAEWRFGATSGTYVPLRSLGEIAKAVGREIPDRWELHYQRVEQAEAERDGAYRERAQLVALLAAEHPAVVAPAPDVDEPGWQILYLQLDGRQCSWHIHPRDAELFGHVERVEQTDERARWDGHSTEEKYQRIAVYAAERAKHCGRECREGHTYAGACELAMASMEHETGALPELTREDAVEAMQDMATDLYKAEDRLAFVREMCDQADREGRTVTTEQIRAWTAYEGCANATPDGAAFTRSLAAALDAMTPGAEPVFCHHEHRIVQQGVSLTVTCTACPAWATSTEGEPVLAPYRLNATQCGPACAEQHTAGADCQLRPDWGRPT